MMLSPLLPPFVKTTTKGNTRISAGTCTVISLALLAVCGGIIYYFINGLIEGQRRERARLAHLAAAASVNGMYSIPGYGQPSGTDTRFDENVRRDLDRQYGRFSLSGRTDRESVEVHGSIRREDRDAVAAHENEEVRRNGEEFGTSPSVGEESGRRYQQVEAMSEEAIRRIPDGRGGLLIGYLECSDLGLLHGPDSFELEDMSSRVRNHPMFEDHEAGVTTASHKPSSSSEPTHHINEHQTDNEIDVTDIRRSLNPAQHREHAELDEWRAREEAKAKLAGRKTL
jgi:hypothetical protein